MILAQTNDSSLIQAITTWHPRGLIEPSVDLEPRPNGLRVKLTYLGVETGVLFAWEGWGTSESVQGCLDRLFDILSWRVTSPPSHPAGDAAYLPSCG
jgi:hypothetical protein